MRYRRHASSVAIAVWLVLPLSAPRQAALAGQAASAPGQIATRVAGASSNSKRGATCLARSRSAGRGLPPFDFDHGSTSLTVPERSRREVREPVERQAGLLTVLLCA